MTVPREGCRTAARSLRARAYRHVSGAGTARDQGPWAAGQARVAVVPRRGGGDGVAHQGAELVGVDRVERGEADAALPAGHLAEPVGPRLGQVLPVDDRADVEREVPLLRRQRDQRPHRRLLGRLRPVGHQPVAEHRARAHRDELPVDPRRGRHDQLVGAAELLLARPRPRPNQASISFDSRTATPQPRRTRGRRRPRRGSSPAPARRRSAADGARPPARPLHPSPSRRRTLPPGTDTSGRSAAPQQRVQRRARRRLPPHLLQPVDVEQVGDRARAGRRCAGSPGPAARRRREAMFSTSWPSTSSRPPGRSQPTARSSSARVSSSGRCR